MAEKKEFRYFTIADVEREQEYLRWQHRRGWRFTGVTGIGTYHFESCEPEEVVYQLDYSPSRKANFSEYVQMYRDCGWEYLQDFAGFSYFCKPVSQMESPEEIFCDDDSRREMIGAVIRHRLPVLVISVAFPLCYLLLFLLPQLIQGYSPALTYAAVTMTIVLIPLWVVIIVTFSRLWKYWRSLQDDRWE